VTASLVRRIVAEGVGTALLLATVVGSGIVGERLSGGNVAIALLANTLATGAALVALILTFGPVSGAHFNPAVSFADASQGGLSWRDAVAYSITQRRSDAVPFAVGAYFTAAYWFTASTSFANPAVTIARSVTDTFAGIRLADVPAFLIGQAAGATLATLLFRWFVPVLPAAADRVVVAREDVGV
jgi:glycerol uptake facilitator-like aquaporin